MKQFYLSFIAVFLLSTFSIIAYGQQFVPKPYSQTRLAQSYSGTVNINLNDVFEYPQEISQETDIASSVSFVFQNEALSLYECKYNVYNKAVQMSFNVKPNWLGDTKVVVRINMNGVVSENELSFSLLSVIAANDVFQVAPSISSEIDVIYNDSFFNSKNGATLEIVEQPKLGNAVILQSGAYNKIQYQPNASVSNYSIDTFKYKVTTSTGETSTASVVLNIHMNPYASKTFDFLPAPGQFTNTAISVAAAKDKPLGANGSMVSLGGWGGYIIFGFDQPIVNRPDNAYGVDFTVLGNAFSSWSEPAAVMVMKDTNGNGLPDDGEWYELAGSEYHFKSTIKNMTMTYYNPKYNERYTIPYSTDKGIKGAMLTNSFHKQSYYPDPFDFDISPDSVSYTGTFTKYLLDKSAKGYVTAKRPPLFGYADSRPNNTTPTKPRNPYFADENGAAADGFDLSWAVDRDGNHVELDTVHFVKIYATVQEDGGWLGEVSPEIVKVAITTPDPTYVARDYYAHYIGVGPLQVLKGTTYQYEGILFKNGRPVSGDQIWTSSEPSVGSIDNGGLFTGLKSGQTTIYFTQDGDKAKSDSLKIDVVELEEVVLEIEGNSSASSELVTMVDGETIYITAQCIDNRTSQSVNGYVGNRYVYETFTWTSSNPEIGTIDNGLFRATKAGETYVYATSINRPDLQQSMKVVVEERPVLTLKQEIIKIDDQKRTGNLKTTDLFNETKKATIFLKDVNVVTETDAISEVLNAEIDKNILLYNYEEGKYGTEKLLLDVEYFNNTTRYALFLNSENPKPVGIEKVIVSEGINVYPNPFVEGFNICLENSETATLYLYDIVGKLILNKQVLKNEYINLNSYPAGQYIVKVTTNNGLNLTSKLIKK